LGCIDNTRIIRVKTLGLSLLLHYVPVWPTLPGESTKEFNWKNRRIGVISRDTKIMEVVLSLRILVSDSIYLKLHLIHVLIRHIAPELKRQNTAPDGRLINQSFSC
ncbi:hypothetical protein L9F63_015606, partial [Diploptera punctata]